MKHEQTGIEIYAEPNDTVIHATLRSQDLYPAFMDVIRDTPEYVQLMQAVPAYAQDDDDSDFWDSEEMSWIMEELFDVLDSYAPDGYYFGANEGNGSDFAYWENTEPC